MRNIGPRLTALFLFVFAAGLSNSFVAEAEHALASLQACDLVESVASSDTHDHPEEHLHSHDDAHQHTPNGPVHAHSQGHVPGQLVLSANPSAAPSPLLIQPSPVLRSEFLPVVPETPARDSVFRPPIA